MAQADHDGIYLHDRKSNTKLLVDTGAGISFFPATEEEKNTRKLTDVFCGANSESIPTWGEKKVTIDLGLGRSYIWNFNLSNTAILAADFMAYYHFIVDPCHHRVVDEGLRLHREAHGPTAPPPPIEAPPDDAYGTDCCTWLRMRTLGRSVDVLVDTGSTWSVVPAEKAERVGAPTEELDAHTGKIKVYGTRRALVYVPHYRRFKDGLEWSFKVCYPLNNPIVGNDFLKHYGFCVDMKQQCLLPATT